MHFVSIDPSCSHTGLAAFNDDKLIHASLVSQPTSGLSFTTRIHLMTVQILELVFAIATNVPELRTVVIEQPEMWQSARGRDSCASESIQRLYALVGALYTQFCTLNFAVYCIIPVAWKGTAPKAVMVERAYKKTAKHGIVLPPNMRHDVCEAILLGLHAYPHISGAQSLKPYQQVWPVDRARKLKLVPAIDHT